jgi:hypothetical protein
MHGACGIIDTACTIDERFERPRQTLKGISIKNIYVPEMSFPTPKKNINLRGYLTKKAQGVLFDEKTKGRKSRVTVPLIPHAK